jgi:hypothetical protein
MIYYLKQEVSIGDKITINGMKITLIQEIINDNPEMFEVKEEITEYIKITSIDRCKNWYRIGDIYKILDHEQDCSKYYSEAYDNGETRYDIWISGKHTEKSTKEAYDRKELLKEAKKRFPIGTATGDTHSSPIKGALKVTDLEWYSDTGIRFRVPNRTYYAYVYYRGKWAEIVKPLFTTEDGVEIYKGDDVFIYNKSGKEVIFKFDNYFGRTSNCNLYFSTKEAAEAWIKENRPKEKTLEDYEKMLIIGCTSENSNVRLKAGDYKGSGLSSYFSNHFYNLLRENEPKLYWTKVLQLIADDLNGDWIYKSGAKYFDIFLNINNYSTMRHIGMNLYSDIRFKNSKNAKKAIKLMGDKLDYIFK